MRPALILSGLLFSLSVWGESGYDAWLRYQPIQYRDPLPAFVVAEGDSPVIVSARDELIRGIRGMLGRTPRIESRAPAEGAIILRTTNFSSSDGFELKAEGGSIVVSGATDRGVLYGVFGLLRKIALGETVANLDEKQTPFTDVRWVNHWDNLDGSIERGYGGRSLFWDNLHARTDLTRASDYGRLLASLGINGCSINNVNANPRVLASDFLPELVRIADALRPWGVRTVLSVDFGSPKSIGGLDTFDPLDPAVAAWWKSKVDDVYRAIPDLGGFVLKADSEGRVGPSTYGRTHADAANVIAQALEPHGGLLFYRGFVYDHHMDWDDPKNDRARAAVDNFRDLDGKFEANAVLQIKNGPIDFQVREPVSPLFGALEKTNRSLELQITQEYTGQARHAVFLVPMWKEALDFDLRVGGEAAPLKSLAKGGIIGVSNAGLDENWFGNHLSQANLYGFGRLAWDPDLSSEDIAQEWAELTFGDNPKVLDAVSHILLTSWRTYENYTGPLGLQTLTDITGNHYGVNVEASERNGWGQWHRADEKGVGMDRTAATGTGFIGQYWPEVALLYESLNTCPDDLVLFMHHVPYTHVLHSGKTVIQYLYDSHYDGAEAVDGYVREWRGLKGVVDEQRYNEVLTQLEYQAGQAEVWRDAVANWFFRASGLADAKGRVGHYPGRLEAESAELQGYEVADVTPWEAASGGKAVMCGSAQCTATFSYPGQPGWFDLRVQYFDKNNGSARYRAWLNDQLVDQWTAADHLPTQKIDGSSSTRRTIRGLALRPGDLIRIEGSPDGGEAAALDYIETVEQKR